MFVIESAGSLATTQEVLDRIHRDLQSPAATESLASVDHLFEAALYVSRLGRQVAEEQRPAMTQACVDGTATFILGGQVGDEPPDIMLVYPEGNYIRASEERPFLQIGESKYGKFMLELAVEPDVDRDTVVRIALGSMMSTAQANPSVGPPYDVGICLNDAHAVKGVPVRERSPLLARLCESWERHLLSGIAELQTFSHEDLGS